MPATERRYRVLGRRLAVSSDRPEFLDLFDRDFGCFRIPRGTAPRPRCSLAVGFDAVPPRLDIRPAEDALRRVRSVELPDVRPRFVLEIVQREVLRMLPDYLFLHAAAAVRDGAVMAVSGPSGAGKTTLLRRLIREGFGVFSDEYAPIHVGTGLVAPFPRAFAVRVKRDDPMRRRFVEAASWGVSPERRPAPMKQLAFLATAPAPGIPGTISLVIETERTSRLMADLGLGSGARVNRIGRGAYDAVVIPPPRTPADRIRTMNAMNAHRGAILHVRGREERRGVFAREPEMRRLTAAEAAPMLMAQLVDNASPWLTEKPGAAFFRVCRLLQGVSCWLVRCGTPARTAAALAAAWRETLPR